MRLPPAARKPVFAALAVLMVVFDVLLVGDMLNKKTDTAEGLAMLLGSIVVLFLLYRKFSSTGKD